MKVPPLNDPKLGFPLVEKGVYEVTIYDSKDKEFETGPGIEWQLRIVEGEKFEGQKLFLRTPVPSKMLRWLTETVGLDIKKEHDPEEYYGKRLCVQVIHQDWQGEPRAAVSKLIPALEKKDKKGKKSDTPF